LLHITAAAVQSMNPQLFFEGKIFIVDDELANCQLLELILSRAGYKNLSVTTDSRRVASMLMDDDPDLVLLDLHMPHLDGYEVLELLRGLVPQGTFLPVIVLTADVTLQAKHRALSSGAHDFLSKPFDNAEVLLRVENALRTRFLHRQLVNQKAVLEEQVKERTELLEESVNELRLSQRSSDVAGAVV
jgi:putative two-component system response regulator